MRTPRKRAINISDDERYGDIIKACFVLRDEYGGMTNALAVMVRDSALFQEITKKIKRNPKLLRGMYRNVMED